MDVEVTELQSNEANFSNDYFQWCSLCSRGTFQCAVRVGVCVCVRRRLPSLATTADEL